MTRRPTANRFSLSEGASIFALAILLPLAVQGLTLVLLRAGALFASQPALQYASTLSAAVYVPLILLIQFTILAIWWIALCRIYGREWVYGILAAIPLIGIFWAFSISAHLIRSRESRRRLPVLLRAGLGIGVAACLLALPASIAVADTLHLREVQRLSQPCSTQVEGLREEPAAVAVSGQSVSAATLDAWARDVANQQQGALLQEPDGWTRWVAQIWIEVALKSSTSKSSRNTVGDVEDRLLDYNNDEGRLSFVPSDLAFAYVCYDLINSMPDNNWKTAKVQIDPAIGYWDPTIGVVSNPPELAPQDPGKAAAAIQYAVSVDYDPASIPDQVFTGTRTWTADLCASAGDLLEPRYQAGIKLFKRVKGSWVAVPGAKALVERPGRCQGGQVNVLIGDTASESPPNWIDKGPRTCVPYQVRLPETPTFRSASVDMCVSVDATSDTEEQ